MYTRCPDSTIANAGCKEGIMGLCPHGVSSPGMPSTAVDNFSLFLFGLVPVFGTTRITYLT
jgi:hypothetical protein